MGRSFSLYALIDALHIRADSEGKPLSTKESALIKLLYRQTFELWEQEQASRAARCPPSFICGFKDSTRP